MGSGPTTASAPPGESFAYDTIGNMTSKAGTALSYGTTSPKHAVKSHGTTTYTYDANGSLTAKGTQIIKYDPEQRPILVQDGTSIHRAAYDGDGVRRKRQDSNGTVHYLGGYERKLADTYNSEAVTKYYSASLGALSRPVAFRRGGTLHWVGADHLGGTIRVMDSGFTALDGMRYKPYGEDRDTGSSLNTDRKFTGQTEDEAAGLYWYASRAYDPAIGRFVSPDSIVPDPLNPQSLNRYSYVYNNPLKHADPSGRTPEAEGWDEHWAKEYARDHGGRRPTWADWQDRQFSLLNRGSGPDGDWTDQNWESLTRLKEDLAENYNPTIVLGPQAREDFLAENVNTTIQPRDPLDATQESIFDQVVLSAPGVNLGPAQGIQRAVTDPVIDLLEDKLDDVTGFRARANWLHGHVAPLGRAVSYTLVLKEEREAGSSNLRAGIIANAAAGGDKLGAVLAVRGYGLVARRFPPLLIVQRPLTPTLEVLGGYLAGEATKGASRWILDRFDVR